MNMVLFREILEDLDGIFGKTHVLIQSLVRHDDEAFSYRECSHTAYKLPVL